MIVHIYLLLVWHEASSLLEHPCPHGLLVPQNYHYYYRAWFVILPKKVSTIQMVCWANHSYTAGKRLLTSDFLKWVFTSKCFAVSALLGQLNWSWMLRPNRNEEKFIMRNCTFHLTQLGFGRFILHIPIPNIILYIFVCS